MTQITIPVAATWIRIYLGVFLAVVFLAGTRATLKALIACIQIGRGTKPLPPYLPSQKFAQIGMLISAALTVFCLWCGFLVLVLLTSGPTTLTYDGIRQGRRPPYYQQTFIAWSDVVRVNCKFSRTGSRIGRLEIYSSDEGKVVLGRVDVSLEDVRAFIASHVPPGTLQPCS